MDQSLELVIRNPQEGKFLKKIEWNKDAFMALISSMIDRYKGAVYLPEDIATAKKDRADLNALKKEISDRRIVIKKAVMAPYEVFEKEVKEVVDLIDEPLAAIDKTIKESEERARKEKKQELQSFFDENIGELSGILTFDRVFDQRMLNATYSINKAKKEITDAIDRVQKDLQSIDTLVEEKYRLQVKDYYCRTMNISGAMGEASRLKELDRRLEEQRERERIRKEQEAARKAEAEARAAKKEEEPEQKPQEAEQDAPKPEQEPPKQEQAQNAFVQAAKAVQQPKEPAKLYKARFYAIGTKEQIMALKQYMIYNKIEFGKVV